MTDEQRLLASYEMLTLQGLEEHAHMWQTPALGLTAQAFLFTVSLDPAVAPASRALAAGLGAVVALLSLQLMIKHQFHLKLDRAQLNDLEERLGLVRIGLRRWGYHDDGSYDCDLPGAPEQRWPHRLHSAFLWKLGLSIFAAADLVVLAVLAHQHNRWINALVAWLF